MNVRQTHMAIAFVVLGTCGVWLALSGVTVSSEPPRPNIILIFCDNLGYGDVGCFNPKANGPWGDSVEELDWSTGEILDALKRLDLDEKTLVIWTNDNGAPAPDRRGGSNFPLKGNAYSVAEGGMRVPFIARWPGRIPAGTVCREVITLMDMLPTLAQLAGAEVPSDRIIDGHDIRPLMFAQPDATSPTKAFFYYYVNHLQAVRCGQWKLYLPQPAEGRRAEIPMQIVQPG